MFLLPQVFLQEARPGDSAGTAAPSATPRSSVITTRSSIPPDANEPEEDGQGKNDCTPRRNKRERREKRDSSGMEKELLDEVWDEYDISVVRP